MGQEKADDGDIDSQMIAGDWGGDHGRVVIIHPVGGYGHCTDSDGDINGLRREAKSLIQAALALADYFSAVITAEIWGLSWPTNIENSRRA